MESIQQDTSKVFIKDTILQIVNEKQGIKAVELVLKVMDIVNPARFNLEEYNEGLTQLIHNREIIELEYILPNMENRVKSIYFPKGTIFEFNRPIVIRRMI